MIAIAKWERTDRFGDLLPKRKRRKPPGLPRPNTYAKIGKGLARRRTRQTKLAYLATCYLRVAQTPVDSAGDDPLVVEEERYAFLDALAEGVAKQYSY